MKILFFTKYTDLAANTRYRCLQYLPYLESHGIQCDVSALLGNDYLTYKFTHGGAPVWTVIKAYFRRLWELRNIKKYDAVVLHYELFPYFPALFECLFFLMGVPYICDYDDAIFHNYDNHKNPLIRTLLRKKIANVIRYSSGVLAGNKYLAKYANNSSPKVTLIPTVVDMSCYERQQKRNKTTSERPFTIGWIGSPSTANYILKIGNTLKKFCLNHHAQVVLIGSGPVKIPGLPLVIKDWDEKTEIEELAQFDVGIMPLTNDPWARGKCGFKLIQYMASELPTIASPVGVNSELVEHSRSGFLASTEEEWLNALHELYENKELRQQMGVRGRELVREKYSLTTYAPVMRETISELHHYRNSEVGFTNVDHKVTKSFGNEWSYFRQEQLSDKQLRKIFDEYFDIFPWDILPKDGGVGVDIGCGSGRWAKFVAPKVRELHLLEASDKALDVARKTLNGCSNTRFHFASVGNLPFQNESLDFAYSIGVLHHIPDPAAGLVEIARTLKPGSPFMFYIYYSFENRGLFYKTIWKVSDVGRFFISRMPFPVKFWVSEAIAATIYWPLARFGNILAKAGILPHSWTLSFYKDKPFYVMRTDALDRFGTRLEKRFSRAEIRTMMENAGFKDIRFATTAPYWVGVGIKA